MSSKNVDTHAKFIEGYSVDFEYFEKSFPIFITSFQCTYFLLQRIPYFILLGLYKVKKKIVNRLLNNFYTCDEKYLLKFCFNLSK